MVNAAGNQFLVGIVYSGRLIMMMLAKVLTIVQRSLMLANFQKAERGDND